jgi:hypothetical protein
MPTSVSIRLNLFNCQAEGEERAFLLAQAHLQPEHHADARLVNCLDCQNDVIAYADEIELTMQ